MNENETLGLELNIADPKLNAAVKGIYDNLSDELKEKAKQCKTTDELMELAGEEGIELPDEVVDQVAGGCGVSKMDIT